MENRKKAYDFWESLPGAKAAQIRLETPQGKWEPFADYKLRIFELYGEITSEEQGEAETIEINGNLYEVNKDYIGLSFYIDDANQIRKGVIDDKAYWEVRKDYRKIIATNDLKLIKEGVPALVSPPQETPNTEMGFPLDEPKPWQENPSEQQQIEILGHEINAFESLDSVSLTNEQLKFVDQIQEAKAQFENACLRFISSPAYKQIIEGFEKLGAFVPTPDVKQNESVEESQSNQLLKDAFRLLNEAKSVIQFMIENTRPDENCTYSDFFNVPHNGLEQIDTFLSKYASKTK